MPEFRTRYRVKAPLSAVVKFHEREDALARLTPPPLQLDVLAREPLAEGSRLVFRLGLGPLGIIWEAIHQDVDLQHGFTDEQRRGPLQFWRHRHTFFPQSDGYTVIEEHITYAYRPGWRSLWTWLVFSPLGLHLLFAYRRWAIRRALEQT